MLEHLPSSDHAMVIKKITNTWKLADKNEEVESIDPPLEQIKLGKEEIKTTPLKCLEPTNDMIRQSYVVQIMKQNNFTNIHL